MVQMRANPLPFLVSTLVIATIFVSSSYATEVSYDNRAILIDGERKLIVSGSIHYPRSTTQMWPDLIQKSKDGGLNAIETYVFWNAHEPLYREYDFSGNLDLVRFLKTIQEAGLYAILRIGPYVCAEWNYGGFPVWLSNMPNMTMRTNNEAFKYEMQNFINVIIDKMKDNNLFASTGGPIILAQIENEYGDIQSSYGEDGKAYVQWCANLALGYNIGVPWIMCQQNDAPEPIISTCNGYYCDGWNPRSKNIPKIWTENWTGWFKDWGMKDPHRTAEDLAFAVARFFQLGGTVQNYYMYHGGTNFGRTAGGPYITTSYDYDAPLDEFGNLNQPKWGHLRQLHFILRSMEKALTYGERTDKDFGNQRYATTYSYQGKSSVFLANSDNTIDQIITYEGTNYTIPAWSVSILVDGYTVAYNTAKVNTQTSVMVKKSNEADNGEEPFALKWKWRSEPFVNPKKVLGTGKSMIAKSLLDQKVMNDTSDYLWYMTSVDMQKNDPIWGHDITLHVHTNGHAVHAFVNGKHVGSQWATNNQFEFQYEQKIKLKLGVNQITLLSVTVGLQNYGANFDSASNGIRGPVRLIVHNGSEEINKYLSNNQWVYKVGLEGEEKKLFKLESSQENSWFSDNRPANRMFVWYKTTFPAPLGSDPVVVDLQGLGKGEAWINGKSIGRYWPSYLADEHGCDYKCDYRGSYYSDKCVYNCGKSSQRWYHVPREFLNADDNVLILFEELGGTPDLINFQTVTVGNICADAEQGKVIELSCQGGATISSIKFASFGDAAGNCGSFKKGTCESVSALSFVENACVGKESCSIEVSEAKLGATGCKYDNYRLAVEAFC